MLPIEPYAKLFQLCEEHELIRIMINDNFCIATVLKRNFRFEVLAFMPDRSVVLIDPHLDGSSTLLPFYQQSTVLSYGTDWRIEIDHTIAPIQRFAGDAISNGSVVLTTINGNGGKKDSRAYLAVDNSKIPNLLLHFAAKDRSSGLDNTSFEFTSWSIIAPKVTLEPMFSHR